MKTTINVGLLGSPQAPKRAVRLRTYDRMRRAASWALTHLSGPVLMELRTDVPEPTLVIAGVFLRGPKDLHQELRVLAERTDQDAIAFTYEQFDARYSSTRTVGILAGPRAAAWEPFNPDLFLTHQGVSL